MLIELIVSLRAHQCFRAHLLSVSCFHSDEIVNYLHKQKVLEEALHLWLFSRAVALLFNWKYFGGEISCGRCADDTQMTQEQDFGRDFIGDDVCRLHVIYMSSRSMHLIQKCAPRPEVCTSSRSVHLVQKHAHHPHVVCTLSGSMHVVRTGQQLCINPTGFLV